MIEPTKDFQFDVSQPAEIERFKDENDWSAVCGATACDESQIGQVEWKFGFDKIVWESSAELLVKI